MVKFLNFLKKHSQSLSGWLAGIVGFIIYRLTVAPTVTFWDSGEFIASAYGLQVGHAPGAPVYQLLSKVFSLFFRQDPLHAAYAINVFSAFCSGLTLVFLYWTLVWLIRKTTRSQIVISSGSWIGTLSFAFIDSFWSISTEAEVYALATLFSAIMLWIATKWESANKENSARWIVLMGFVTGLSMGVHWLCLLVLPAIFLIFYFKRDNATSWGVLLTIGISGLVLLVVLSMLPLGILPIMESLELFFVNKLHFPIGVAGTVFLILLWLGLIGVAVIAGELRQKNIHVWLWSLVFFCLGYSFYLIPVVRSQAGVPLNQGNPHNVFMLRQYLLRSQYEKAPLIYGPCYTATPAMDFKDGALRYVPMYTLYDQYDQIVASSQNKKIIKNKAKNHKQGYILENYAIIDSAKNVVPVYDERLCMLFPRMWSAQNISHEYGYINWVGEPEDIVFINDEDKRTKPSFKQNIQFFVSYQLNYMYWRYFLWNFAGRFNDVQGFSFSQDGAWVSGVPFLDDYLVGSARHLSDFKEAASHNTYFFLPLILGLIGLFYHLQKHTKSLVLVLTLFLFTGVAIVIYVNQYAYQPRERDYSYIMSFYAFALWIGAGAAAVAKSFLRRFRKVGGAIAGGLLCLSVPMLLLAENYCDHNRSENYTARNFAISLLESCEPDAILFTNGDNDTYPLWYVQHVEGVRRDVRVINLALLNADWYIEQLREACFDAAPLSFAITPAQYMNSEYNVSYVKGGTLQMNLSEALDSLYSEQNNITIGDKSYHYLPTNHIFITIKKRGGEKSDTVSWSLEEYALTKSDMMLLEILARNTMKHPVYFSSFSIQNPVGLQDCLLQTGLAYKMVGKNKVKENEDNSAQVDTETMLETMLYRFSWEGFKNPEVYYSAYDREIIAQFRQSACILADALNAKEEYDKALAVLDFVMDTLDLKIIPMDNSIEHIAYAYGNAGDFEAAHSLLNSLLVYTEQDIRYLVNLTGHYKKNARLRLVSNYHRLLNMAAFSENRGMEADRIAISEKIFRMNNIYYEYIKFILEDLCSTPERAQFFLDDVAVILELALRISDFCYAYEERSQGEQFYLLYETYGNLLEE